MFVFSHQGEKGVERVHFRRGRVAVPFEIGAHPIDFPEVLRFDIGGFGNRRFHFLAWVVPNGADFEQFDALALQAKTEVEFVANMRRRAVCLDEPVKRFFDAFAFEFVEGHRMYL